ncbi:cell division protein FtsQ [Formosa agariphila KMM 3901]|uniref:Cell division protein FtsQ n=1 Tax=Formosa agariphila (strain DSM 15362 / KCTC 12365 / LMG 23005 / KMM 3901 / M-2Alg 35-1) TaxID=1347342 RepID=T2KPI2_FORAG|nr:cell division protein FtsQ/DivIB [Formosa agariphila]CDF80660.1 cell division protein FtsQ [Formosa agariphila KMM 3901]
MSKIHWGYVKLIVLSGIVLFLFAFASARNSQRKISEPIIHFMGDNNLYITQENVSNLLIQKEKEVSEMTKETLDLNTLEFALNSNPLIKSAQVYVDVNGSLTADIEQKLPIARIQDTTSYYLDDRGGYMPLSTNHTARVPFVVGHIEKNNLSNVFIIAQKVYNDTFLKKHVVEIHQDETQKISLKLRQHRFNVYLGDLTQLDKKINNLKVFYKKALEENSLKDYDKINLQFDNQVVCTKN